MAKKKKNIGNLTSSIETNTFIKGMNKDVNATFLPKQSWFHARNAYNNSADGDAGTLGNEPANLRCVDIPYSIIGAIYKQGDQWYIFSTDDVSSEIGILDDSKCEYKTLINDPCLNFKRTHLITGASKENYDCTWQVYWDDNLNPSRTLNEDEIPYVQIQITGPDINGDPCVTYEDTTQLDCEKIRLAPLVQTPCIELTKNIDGGLIENGSYQAYIAYVENEQKVTDYIGISNVQSLFDHDQTSGSLNITITNLDDKFDFFELVLLCNTKEQSVARKIGIYSTKSTSIAIDYIDLSVPSISLQSLFARNPAYEKSESMYVVNDYLIRQGPTEQFDFNYQPLANQIQVKWQVAEYPADYYHKGGNKTSFMRDEQYAFFIRWIYNTGERSASYHIPGRPPKTNGFVGNGRNYSGSEIDTSTVEGNVVYIGSEQNWQALNTASQLPPIAPVTLPDGGVIIAEGEMGFWQSTERYPATQPEIWNSTYVNPVTNVNIGNTTDTRFDLCGVNIRHHKMPSEESSPTGDLNLSNVDGSKIRLLGAKFLNIQRPVFNDGTVIPNIVGYEILRGSREGNKSILAKGIFRNMREYTIPEEDGTDVQGLYPNYPYNDLRDDTFFHDGNVDLPFLPQVLNPTTGKRTEDLQIFGTSILTAPPLKGFRRDVFTFHTPELPFRKPYLNAYETRIYGKYKGFSDGYFKKSEEHPGQKLLRNIPVVFAGIVGIAYAMEMFKGKKNNTNLPVQLVHHNPDFVNRIATGESGTRTIIPLAQGTGSLEPGSLNDDGNGKDLRQPGDLTSPTNLFGVAPGMRTSFMEAYALLGGASGGQIAFNQLFSDFGSLADIVLGGVYSDTQQTTQLAADLATIAGLGGTQGGGIQTELEGNAWKSLPTFIRTVFSIPGFLVYTAEGANVIIDLFYNLMSYQDYALKHNSDGLYSDRDQLLPATRYRSENLHSNYIGGSFVKFGDSTTGLFKINNLFRPSTIVIQTEDIFQEPFVGEDQSRYSLGQLEHERSQTNPLFLNVHTGLLEKIRQPICSLYGALKFRMENQYGQLPGVKQTPMRGCVQYIDETQADVVPLESEAFFAGDVYINRYTEKTIMPIFTDFLYGQPDGFTYDYLKYVNIPYPRYWMNTERYDFTKLYSIFENLGPTLQSASGAGNATQDEYFTYLPSDMYALDAPIFSGTGNTGSIQAFAEILSGLGAGLFGVVKAFMYTHINGVQDFFVESELNIANRDWLDQEGKRHYDPYRYTDLNELFDAKVIKINNFYLYDYSLSISRQISNLTNFSFMQPLDYNPDVAETCFTFYPKRLIYSLRAQEESKKDFWRVFLPNNYKDFKNKVSVIKPVNETGALMFFPYASPKIFKGVDELQTSLDAKVILGDGGLFNRDPQNITNSDLANEYASCESARSVINTPMGVFFISQAQGKIFQYAGRLQAISDIGMKWWFNKYLPSFLLKQFPELEGTELEDNPVVGIGCQAIYDINDDIVYFMKRDYSVKETFVENISFDAERLQFVFSLNDITSFDIEFGDPEYFDNASWTVSYDPKVKGWISFHDWHPELSLPSINHFLTTKTFKSDQPLCPDGYYLDPNTGLCTLDIQETAPGFVDIDVLPASENCQCEDGYTLVYANPNDGFQYNSDTPPNPADPNDCTAVDIQTTIIGGNTQSTDQCDCYEAIKRISLPSSIIQLQYINCDGGLVVVDRDSFGNFPDSLPCMRFTTLTGTGGDPQIYYKPLLNSNCPTYPCCKCYTYTIENTGSDEGLQFSFINCDGTQSITYTLFSGEQFPIPCAQSNSFIVTDLFGVIANQNVFALTEIQECGTYPCGPTILTTTTEYPAICRKIDCGCPDSPIPNGTLIQQNGDCDSLDIYQTISIADVPPNLIECIYSVTTQIEPSYLRGSIWRHNYRCDLYANYYDIDYPWEVELVENTGQAVNTIRSFEYQLESYVYKGDLHDGCGDDRWHDLDFNFDKSIIYNSEQVSGLLTLIPHPKEDPLSMITYPIIGGSDIQILYSKEEQKYRFNQFWDITRDRDEFTIYPAPTYEYQPGITPLDSPGQNIFITQLNGYIKDLNQNNLSYSKTSDQRKKFRHYYNKVLLRRTLSGNRKMLLKLLNTKLNLSMR